MREIKFRAWDKKENKMYPVVVLNIGFGRKDIDEIADPPEMVVGTECTTAVLMQYTGLKDKNGKEIYEGDVVSFGWGDSERGQVLFSPKVGYYVLTKNLGTMYFQHEEQYKIIGNIYENPELIKESQDDG